MSNLDTTGSTGEDSRLNEPEGIPERIDDRSDEHAPAAASDGTVDQPARDSQDSGESADAHVSITGPGVPESASAAAGPTQATTSGAGQAPAAGQDAPTAGSGSGPGPTDSVGAAEAASAEAGAGTGKAPAEPGANGGMDSRPDAGVDPVTELAEELGFAPGATDAVDPGQDNGLSS